MKQFLFRLIILVGLCSVSLQVSAQGSRSEFCVRFPVGGSALSQEFSDNRSTLNRMEIFLDSIRQDETLELTEITFCGAASPEGSYQVNRKLATARMKALESWVKRQITVPDSIISYDDSYIPWEWLDEQIRTSDIPHKKEVLNIIILFCFYT